MCRLEPTYPELVARRRRPPQSAKGAFHDVARSAAPVSPCGPAAPAGNFRTRPRHASRPSPPPASAARSEPTDVAACSAPNHPIARPMDQRNRPRASNLRLAADIGGTFTDIAAFDDRTGNLTFGKALSTPDRLVEGINAGVEKAGIELPGRRAVPPRLDHRDQHHPGAQGRQDRAAHHRRLPRHLRDRPHQSARCLQSVLPEARAAGRAGAAVRGQGARAGRRRDRDAARRGGDRRIRPAAGAARRGSRRHSVSQLLRPARPRGARQGDPGAQPPEHVRLGLA